MLVQRASRRVHSNSPPCATPPLETRVAPHTVRSCCAELLKRTVRTNMRGASAGGQGEGGGKWRDRSCFHINRPYAGPTRPLGTRSTPRPSTIPCICSTSSLLFILYFSFLPKLFPYKPSLHVHVRGPNATTRNTQHPPSFYYSLYRNSPRGVGFYSVQILHRTSP